MSIYYVVGCNQCINNIKELNVNFEEISGNDLKKFVRGVAFNQRFYYVSNCITLPLSLKNEENVNFDLKGNDKLTFIEFVKKQSYLYQSVEFYKFWSLFDDDDTKEELNLIYDVENIDLLKDVFNPKIDFDFNIKYVFNII